MECKSGQDSFAATVVDIATRGARLETPQPLQPGQLLIISYRPGGVPVGRQRLKCEVAWSDAGHAGIKFVDTEENIKHSWAHRILSELGFDDRSIFKRKSRRADAVLPTVLFLVDQDELSCHGTILNIGVGGALVRIPTLLEDNARLRMEIGPYAKLPLLQLFGRVLRSRPEEGQEDLFLHNIRFLNQDGPEVELLGKYVITLLKEANEKK